MGLYKRVKGEEEEQNDKSFNLVELEQAFGRAYRSYRINGRSKVDVETFFDWIRQNLINLISGNWVQQGYKRLHELGLGWRWRMTIET